MDWFSIIVAFLVGLVIGLLIGYRIPAVQLYLEYLRHGSGN